MLMVKRFWSSSKNNLRTYSKIQKIVTGQEDDYTTVYLLGYAFFTEHYKMIAIDWSKLQSLHAGPKKI